RNAAKVLPEPVGAAISACRPERIAGHAATCAGVGAAKAPANQAATAGWNARSASGMRLSCRPKGSCALAGPAIRGRTADDAPVGRVLARGMSIIMGAGGTKA